MDTKNQDELPKRKCLGWCNEKNPVIEGHRFCKECDEKRKKISSKSNHFFFASNAKTSFKAPPQL
jgi:hypothetical protein